MIDTEPFLAEALSSLRARLPARIDAINETSADVVLEKPRDDGGPIGSPDLDYYLGAVVKPLRYPLVEVAVPNWTMTGFDLGMLTASASFPMLVGLTARDASLSSDRLYRMMLRYTRAILNVLLEPNSFGQGAVVTAVSGAYRQNPESNQSEEVIGAVVVAFTLESSEQREA